MEKMEQKRIASTVSYPDKISSFRKKVRNPNKIANLDLNEVDGNKNQKINYSQTSLAKKNKVGGMSKKNMVYHGQSEAGDQKDID